LARRHDVDGAGRDRLNFIGEAGVGGQGLCEAINDRRRGAAICSGKAGRNHPHQNRSR
jgi:hypothetical protein